jgi:hypothetical protein
MKMKRQNYGHLATYLNSLRAKGENWFLREQAIAALNMSEVGFKRAADRLLQKK